MTKLLNQSLIENYPIKKIRSHFPSLKSTFNGKPAIYLNGPSGSQMLQESIEAITNYCVSGCANLHEQNQISQDTMKIIENARKAMALFLGAQPAEVAFGPNTTSLIYQFSRTISRDWSVDDNIVITELDHRANVDPWIAAAEDKNAEIRWIRLDTGKYQLNLDDIRQNIDKNTKIIAIGLASNGLGTINRDPIKILKELAHKVGALVVIDAVHAVPHMPINFSEMGVDTLFCSAYKFFGPHLGVAIIRKAVFKKIQFYRVKAAPEYPPGAFETGCLNHEALAGIPPIIEFLVSLGSGKSKEEKIFNTMMMIEAYEHRLAEKIREEFQQIPEIVMYQAEKSVEKTPTIAFNIQNRHPKHVCQVLSQKYGIFAGDGHFYAMTIGEVLNLNQNGGWIRIGLAPYTSLEDVEQFIQAIHEIIAS